MKRKERLGQRRGFTIVELVAVIAIIGVLAVVLVPTLVGVVTDSRISSANQTARQIRDRAGEFMTKMDTQNDTHINGSQTVNIVIQDGLWSISGGSASDWLDGVNHWSSSESVQVSGGLPNQSTELLSYLAHALGGIKSAYVEIHVTTSYIVGVSVVEGSTTAAPSMPAMDDFRAERFGFGGSDKAGYYDGWFIGTAPRLELDTGAVAS